MAAQASRAAALAQADDVIDNGGDPSGARAAGASACTRATSCSPARNPSRRAETPSVVSAGRYPSGSVTISGHAARRQMITYEYPLNERIRTLLRLEDLFERVAFLPRADEAHEHHAALTTLFEILEVAGRADLKIGPAAGARAPAQVPRCAAQQPRDLAGGARPGAAARSSRPRRPAAASSGKTGQHLRENEWLMAIKQRTSIPGRRCEFDLPSYHYWLHRERRRRRADLDGWVAAVASRCTTACASCCELLRESGAAGAAHRAARACTSRCSAGRIAQMLRIRLARNAVRARDQRQQVRAQHPLRPAGRRRAHGRAVRARRRLRAELLQPVTAAPRSGALPAAAASSVPCGPRQPLPAVLLRALQADRPRRLGEPSSTAFGGRAATTEPEVPPAEPPVAQ